jgi:predicted nucleic-acid-binding protein
MRGLDTNVLVRYLTQDDEAQSRTANALIERSLEGGERLHVDAIVLCELVWVLRSSYRFERSEVAGALDALIASSLSMPDRDRLREAAARYRKGPGDFSDYLIALTHRDAGCETTVTFDRGHRKTPAFTVI